MSDVGRNFLNEIRQRPELIRLVENLPFLSENQRNVLKLVLTYKSEDGFDIEKLREMFNVPSETLEELEKEYVRVEEPLIPYLYYFLIVAFLLLLVFFGYKLVKSLQDKERKRDEKRKAKQQKKKK